MKNALALVSLLGLSACGAGQAICEFTVDNAIRDQEIYISAAQTHLDEGFAVVDTTEVRKTLDLNAVNNDPFERTAPCMRPDQDGNMRQHLCFYRLSSPNGQRIPIDPAFERKVISEATRELAALRASRESDVARCMGN